MIPLGNVFIIIEYFPSFGLLLIHVNPTFVHSSAAITVFKHQLLLHSECDQKCRLLRKTKRYQFAGSYISRHCRREVHIMKGINQTAEGGDVLPEVTVGVITEMHSCHCFGQGVSYLLIICRTASSALLLTSCRNPIFDPPPPSLGGR